MCFDSNLMVKSTTRCPKSLISCSMLWCFGSSFLIGKSSRYPCLWSEILHSRYAIDSLLWTGATTSSTITFRSNKTCQAGSCSGILGPIRNGSNLNRFQFSWALPPIVFLLERFCGNFCFVCPLVWEMFNGIVNIIQGDILL